MHMHAMMVCHVARLAGGNNCRLWVTQPLMAGMIVSNEPGYYEDDAFGIRIENLLHIREADTPFKFGDQSYFGFERLTMIPIQRKMILMNVSHATYVLSIDQCLSQSLSQSVSQRLCELVGSSHKRLIKS